jgi:zinc/manganese transport system ATP-binding protein
VVGDLVVTAAHHPPGARAREARQPVALRGAALRFGDRTLWQGLDLDVAPGEFVAVLGPNGSGKTTLLRVLLGLQPLHAGEVLVDGRPARRGSGAIGYIPQLRALPEDLTLRARDLVGLGLDGHRRGLGWRGRADRHRRVAAALESVGATHYADAPVGRLSGGEQQRLRVAQALIGDPAVLLCDEPLLSLDLAHQRIVTRLIDQRRRTANTPVLFVTHEINPVLPLVDRVLYLVNGRFRIGTPEEVMTSDALSELYRTDVDVLRVRGRLVVVGADALPHTADDHHCSDLAAEDRR